MWTQWKLESGATESEVWIGNLNVKSWKSTEHKLNNIWRSLWFYKTSEKWSDPIKLIVLIYSRRVGNGAECVLLSEDMKKSLTATVI